jgi:probable rRNA maturation factor
VGSRRTLGGATASRPDGPAARFPVIRVGCDGVQLPLSVARVRRIVAIVLRAEGRAAEPPSRRADITITFVGPVAIRRLNREWKGHDEPTDVLSFALRPPEGGVTGDVYICPAVARGQARLHQVPFGDEIARLVVHGTLHVLGYDHPEGRGRTRSAMWRRQERYLKALA